MMRSIKKITKKFFLLPESNEKYRDNWVKDAISSISVNKDEEKILLDIGAGEQRYKKHLTRGLKYVSQDFCQYEGIGDGKGLQTNKWDTSAIDIVSDATNIPLEDSTVDVILCTEVLEHLPDPRAAVNEFYRLLKPKGVLILTAPFWSLTHFAPYHFSTGFNIYWYQDAFKGKFSIDKVSTGGNYFDCIGYEILRVVYMSRSEKRNSYTSKKLNLIEKFILLLGVRIFSLLSVQNINSEELCNSGFLIMATKS